MAGDWTKFECRSWATADNSSLILRRRCVRSFREVKMKTFLPKLSFLLIQLCRYILRWNVQIKAHLPAPAAPAVDAVLTSCQVLIAIVDGEIPPNP